MLISYFLFSLIYDLWLPLWCLFLCIHSSPNVKLNVQFSKFKPLWPISPTVIYYIILIFSNWISSVVWSSLSWKHNGDEKLNKHRREWLSKFNNEKKWITIGFVHICQLSNKLVLQIQIGKLTIGNIKSARMSWIHTLLCCIFYEHQYILIRFWIERTQVDSATLLRFMERLNI